MINKDLIRGSFRRNLLFAGQGRKKKNVFATSIRFLFSFAIWGFLHIINNLLIIRLLVKQTGGASKFLYSVITLMTHDTLSKMKGVINLTMI